jgi:hypothetical protein
MQPVYEASNPRGVAIDTRIRPATTLLQNTQNCGQVNSMFLAIRDGVPKEIDRYLNLYSFELLMEQEGMV